MPLPPVPDDELLKRYHAYIDNGDNCRAACKALGMPIGNDKLIRKAVNEVRQRGLHLSDGVQDTLSRARISATEARGGWIHDYDADGKKLGATRWAAPDAATDDIIDRIKAAFEDITPAAPVVRTKTSKREDTLAYLPHADFHFGMNVNEEQTGRDYNRKIAVDRILAGTESCIASQPSCETAIIMNAGDLLHANDDTDATPRNKHKLKVEGTHHQNFETAVETTVGLIDMALSWHGSVEYRGIPGNHDPNIPGPLSVALKAYYRGEPRVKIIVDESKFYQRNFGVNFLAAHHGDGRNPKELAAGLPGRFPEEWGKAKQWYFFTAHNHHAKSDTFGHVRWFQLPAVCSLDTHAADLNYGGNAGLRAMTFHKVKGLETDFTVNL